MPAARQELEVEGRIIGVSNPGKVLYPQAGFTKAHVLDYYVKVARWLLPHLKDRPVTLKRYPDGVHGEHFYEKSAPAFTPEWVRTFPVPRRAGGPDIRYVLIDDLPTLVWCANLANLEIHPFLHRAPHIERPTSVVFDLDPGEGADVLRCAEVALLLRRKLQALRLECWVKVSGSKGLQLYVPLNTAVTYADTQPFARGLAEALEREKPDVVVSAMSKALRKTKVFVDWSQNADHKTTVGVYSLRAKRARPFVSLPVEWEELERALKQRDAKALYFEPEPALERLAKTGDLFAQVLKRKQKLPGGTTIPKSLEAYRAKRHFTRKPEPAGAAPRRSRQGSRRRFVVQKHAASRHLHYDLRLEMHGTLKSWAVPKGPPRAEGERRLAMATEDHPFEYLSFEGTIPAGEYGGGTMMAWDTGTYELIEGNYYKGLLRVYFEGKKLRGEYTLSKDAQNGQWSLVKSAETEEPAAKVEDERPVLSGRTMAAIAKGAPPEARFDLSGLPKADLKFVPPMRARLAARLPEGAEWQYEVKFDGYRALAIKDRGAVKLLSRNNNRLDSEFPAVVTALERIEDGTMLDGEIVALDDRGRPSFNLLQNYRSSRRPTFYYVFDLPAYRGKSLMREPLSRRRELLAGPVLASAGDAVRLSETLNAGAAEVVAAAREQGLEGVVAKRVDSVYQPGERSGTWVKFKVNQGQELVIGGYVPGKNHFTSLLVGYYDEEERLIFIAKIKNGFVPRVKDELFARFEELESDVCPFANLPEPKNARRGEALTAEVMKRCVWLQPKLVAQVEYTDWTAANHLRHSKFVGLRKDKDPREVTREVADA